MVFWIDVIRNEPNEGGLFDFVAYFMPISYKILNGITPQCFMPRPRSLFNLVLIVNLEIGLCITIIYKLGCMEFGLSLIDYPSLFPLECLPWSLLDRA